MNRAFTFGAAILLAATVAHGQSAGVAKPAKGSRDLFYNPEPGHQGSKVSVRLNRGGQITEVPPSYRFRDGDRIKLVFTCNFTGNAAVSNTGPSGRTKLLWQGPVKPNSNLELPSNGWIGFDSQKGQEKLTVVLSPKPLTELEPLLPGGSGYSAGQVSQQQEQEILNLLNSRALKNTKAMGGRDLGFVPDGDSPYVFVNSGSVVQQPWGFELFLTHD
ncbi:MAG: DUF4384 domain-containing protein [Thermoanaerobaculia bacterium]|nr:DUF4384 domain-containing protein [Thermoanaerobaculia bacterium]